MFLLGSLIRFDRDQYTWKSDSSQLLRAGQLRWGSNLFHVGILFLFFGHSVGLLTPHFVYEPFMTAGDKQLMAMVSGGLFGLLGFIGVTHAAASPPVRPAHPHQLASTSDIVLLVLLWLQFALGLVTIPLSAQHLDGSMMMKLAEWAQRIVTFRAGAVELLADAGWLFKAHMFLGMTHLPDLPVHPAGACVERLRLGGLPVAPLPGGAQPSAEPAGRPQPAAPSWRRRLKEPTMSTACSPPAAVSALTPASPPPTPSWPASTAWPCTARIRRCQSTNCASAPAPSCCARRRSAAACWRRTMSPPPMALPAKPPAAPSSNCWSKSLQMPEPSEEACRRHHAAHAASYRVGERANVRHILFAVTPGVDVNALRHARRKRPAGRAQP